MLIYSRNYKIVQPYNQANTLQLSKYYIAFNYLAVANIYPSPGPVFGHLCSTANAVCVHFPTLAHRRRRWLRAETISFGGGRDEY